MNFEIRLESKVKDQITLHFASKTEAYLKIRDVKFYTPEECDIYPESYIEIELNSSWEEKVFRLANKPNESMPQYTSMTMIVKDGIEKRQYAVSISLNDGKVAFREMVYEGRRSEN